MTVLEGYAFILLSLRSLEGYAVRALESVKAAGDDRTARGLERELRKIERERHRALAPFRRLPRGTLENAVYGLVQAMPDALSLLADERPPERSGRARTSPESSNVPSRKRSNRR